jgi:hypothetical protein
MRWLGTKVKEIQKRKDLLFESEDLDLVEVYYTNLFDIAKEIEKKEGDLELLIKAENGTKADKEMAEEILSFYRRLETEDLNLYNFEEFCFKDADCYTGDFDLRDFENNEALEYVQIDDIQIVNMTKFEKVMDLA